MIKSLVILTGILCMMTSETMAQRANFGAKGGIHLYRIYGDNIPRPFNIPGMQIGMLCNIHLTKKIGIQPEIAYALHYSHSGGSKYTLHNFNFPLLFQYKFQNGFSLLAGPQPEFYIYSHTVKYSSGVELTESHFSMQGGMSIGTSYVNAPTGIGADLRLNLRIANDSHLYKLPSVDLGIQLGIIYMLNLKTD